MNHELIQNINIWSPEIIALLVGSGLLIGIVNTLAGSGTAISYAVFMMLGLPPAYANGTVRLGVVTQTLAASFNFYKHHFLELRKALFIAIPITLGSMAGAEIAINIDQDVFKIIIGVAMIFMLFFLFYKPEKWIKKKDIQTRNLWWHAVLYFAIGTYGGFIHIGVGIFLLSALVLVSGYDLVHANSLKVFIVMVYTPFALSIFMINGEIHYAMGLISAIGNTLGGIFASNYAMHHGAKPLRWILMAVLIVFSAYLFGAFHYIFGIN